MALDARYGSGSAWLLMSEFREQTELIFPLLSKCHKQHRACFRVSISDLSSQPGSQCV